MSGFWRPFAIVVEYRTGTGQIQLFHIFDVDEHLMNYIGQLLPASMASQICTIARGLSPEQVVSVSFMDQSPPA